jgi:hypothetical protein
MRGYFLLFINLSLYNLIGSAPDFHFLGLADKIIPEIWMSQLY